MVTLTDLTSGLTPASPPYPEMSLADACTAYLNDLFESGLYETCEEDQAQVEAQVAAENARILEEQNKRAAEDAEARRKTNIETMTKEELENSIDGFRYLQNIAERTINRAMERITELSA